MKFSKRSTLRDKDLKFFGRGIRELYLVILIAFISSMAEPFCSAVDQNILKFVQDEPPVNEDIVSVIMRLVLMCVGAILAGPIGDFFGRRAGIVTGFVLSVLGIVIQGSSGTGGWKQFSAGQIIATFGFSITGSLVPVWIAELSPVDLRGRFLGLYYSVFPVLGTILGKFAVDSLNQRESNWRVAIYCQLSFSVFAALSIYFCPESPRWLISKGYYEAAKAFFAKYHGNGNEDAEIVKYQYIQIQETLLEEKQQGSYLRGYLCFFNNRPALFRILTAFLSLFFVGYYMVSGVFSLTWRSVAMNRKKYPMILQLDTILEIISILASVFGSLVLTETLGRRMMLICGAVSVSLGLLWVGVGESQLEAQLQQTEFGEFSSGGDQSTLNATIAGIFVLNILYSMLWIPSQAIYLTEIWTFTQRARAEGLRMILSLGSSIVWQLIISFGVSALQWKFIMICSATAMVWAAFYYFLFPETKKRTLEEITQIFESRNPVRKAKEETYLWLSRIRKVSMILKEMD